jgi:hypothetical protein
MYIDKQFVENHSCLQQNGTDAVIAVSLTPLNVNPFLHPTLNYQFHTRDFTETLYTYSDLASFKSDETNCSV